MRDIPCPSADGVIRITEDGENFIIDTPDCMQVAYRQRAFLIDEWINMATQLHLSK